MKLKIGALVVLIFMAGCRKNPSGLELPAIISDNMLLQQETEVRIWGKATPGKRIEVSTDWNAYGQVISGKDGKWTLGINTPKAGGPYSMIISTKDTSIAISNVLIGEVWICSGQSNMEMPLAGWPPNDTIMYSEKAIAEASVPEIRLFNVQRKVAAEPLEDCEGTWEICTPSTVARFSATAYFFGKKLHNELKIPVGLIESAWGGTPVESWISADALENAGEFRTEIDQIKEAMPILREYQEWLGEHKQLIADKSGEAQWQSLVFDDEEVPEPDYDDNHWPVIKLPGQFETSTGDFDGAVWFRKHVEIPAGMAGNDLILSLGPIDDMDRTYFNGSLVGSHEVSGFWQTERNYEIPKELVKEGIALIAVRVVDNQGGGGIWGKPGSLILSMKSDSNVRISLDGEWKFQPVAELIGNTFYIFDLTQNEFSAVNRPKTIGPSTPAALFNGMISPVVKYPVKGAIWYQGEANVGRAQQYAKIFPLLIRNWREVWNIQDLSFYYVQIAPYVYSGTDSTESAFLREAQEKALELANTGMVVTLDIATVNNIHPPYKKEVGERLANLALAKDYDKDIMTDGPVYKSMIIDGKNVKLRFENIGEGLVAKNGELKEFEIAGSEGIYVQATAEIVDDEVWVSSPEIDSPVSVRYCWRNGSTASLFNSEGLPARQFRTKD